MSSIEWTEQTWNPTTGCTKISKECEFCYAEKETNRLKHNPKQTKYKAGFDVLVEHSQTLSEPYKWSGNKIVFVNSMSDLFHKEVSLSFIKKVFEVMNDTPQHTYQILTKRADILLKYSKELNWTENIWMGVSVGSQISVRKIERLAKCDAKYKFLSVEPLIEELNDYSFEGIDWVIVGGESGHNARPIKKEWIEPIRQKCLEQNVPFFFKQWGHEKNNPNPNDPTLNKLHRYYSKGGSQLNGVTYWDNPTLKSNSSKKSIKLFEEDYFIMDEIEDMFTIWELKSFLPFANKDVFKNLKEDIKKNGVIDPVLYWETENGDKLIIDGHTRIRASIALGRKSIPSKNVSEKFKSLDEIKLWIVKHQLSRRNLTTAEKVMLAYNSKETIEKLAKNNLSVAGRFKQVDKTIDTYNEIAKIAGVGRGTISRYMKVINSKDQNLIDKLHNGSVSINSASNSVKKPKEIKPNQKKAYKTRIDEMSNFEEAENYLYLNLIDFIVIGDSKDIKPFLKTNKDVRIGFLKNL